MSRHVFLKTQKIVNYLKYNAFIFVLGVVFVCFSCNFLILNQCFFAFSHSKQAKRTSSRERATGNLMIII